MIYKSLTEVATNDDPLDPLDPLDLVYVFKRQFYNAKNSGNNQLEGLKFVWADCPRTVPPEKDNIIEEYSNGHLVNGDIYQFYQHSHAKLLGTRNAKPLRRKAFKALDTVPLKIYCPGAKCPDDPQVMDR